MTKKSILIDIVVFQFAETEKAIQVGEDETDRSKAVWLPKSQIEIAEKAVVNGILFHDLTLPEWLAQERGLI